MKRELFDNNRIVESLCQFTFSPVQDNAIYGQFWDELKEEGKYATKENMPSFNLAISDDPKGITPSVVNTMKFLSENKEKIIQLKSNNISIHQLNSYLKWEDFKSDIDSAFVNFKNVTDNPIIERVDLRAINVFEFDFKGFEITDYFNIYTVSPKSTEQSNTSITIEYPLENGNSFLVVRLNSSKKEKMNVVLDLSFVSIGTNLGTNDYDKISEILEQGHIELYKMFTSLITDKTKELIK